MATIHRYPVPAASYQPDRPLNDLGRDQLRHFIHVAQQLPLGFRWEGEPPSPEDGPACTLYIAAVTEHLMAMRKAGLTLVTSKPQKTRQPGKISKPRETRFDIAAGTASGNVPKTSKAAKPKSGKPKGDRP